MSKSRNRYTQQGPENWRRKQYQQPGRGLHEENKSFQFREPLTVKPGLLSTMMILCLLGAALPVSAQASQNKKSIKALVTDKITSDNKLTPAQQGKLDCSHIPELFHNASVKLPFVQPMLERVLTHPKFSISCTTREQIHAATNNELINAFLYSDLDTNEAKMVLADSINEAFIVHETTHADWFFLRRTKQCFVDDIELAKLPIEATTPKYHEYVAALNKGDARILEFKRLREALANKKELTYGEFKKLEKYREAAAECLPVSIRLPISIRLYESLTHYFAENPDQQVYEGMVNYFGEAKQVIIPRFNREWKEGFLCHMQLKESEAAVAIYVDYINSILKNAYPNANNAVLLMERDAYTFQILSEKARKTFYPEAHALREAEIKRCLGEENRAQRLEL